MEDIPMENIPMENIPKGNNPKGKYPHGKYTLWKISPIHKLHNAYTHHAEDHKIISSARHKLHIKLPYE